MKWRSEKRKERDMGDKDEADKDDKDPSDKPEDPPGDEDGITARIHLNENEWKTFQTLTMLGRLTIKVFIYCYYLVVILPN